MEAMKRLQSDILGMLLIVLLTIFYLNYKGIQIIMKIVLSLIKLSYL